jgi:hypothetical protein
VILTGEARTFSVAQHIMREECFYCGSKTRDITEFNILDDVICHVVCSKCHWEAFVQPMDLGPGYAICDANSLLTEKERKKRTRK